MYLITTVLDYDTSPIWWKNLCDSGLICRTNGDDQYHVALNFIKDLNLYLYDHKGRFELSRLETLGEGKIPHPDHYDWLIFFETEEDALAFVLKWS
jgi:hypothetical protein